MENRGRFLFFFCAVLLLAQPYTSSYAQSLKQQQQRRARIEKDIVILQRQLSSTTEKSEQAIASLSLLQAEKKSRRQLVLESEKALAEFGVQIRDVQQKIKKQKAVLDTLQKHYSRLVLGAYKNRDVKVWYMYILSSDNVGQAFRRFGYFKGLSAQIQLQARRIEEVQKSLNEKKMALIALQTKERSVRDERAAELARIQANEQQAEKLVSKLKKDKKSYQQALKAKQSEKKALDKQIAAMIQDAAKQKNRKPVDHVLAKSFESNKGKLPWPVEGPVTEHFGPYKNKELRLSLFNNGINIASESGAKVKAVFEGVVSNVMIAPGYGQCVLIQHGDYYTSYCKLKTATVHQGDKVKTGQVIGEVSTIMGRTQLYFLIWRKQYIDPEIWLSER